MTSKRKFLIVGLGSAGQRHARNLRTLLDGQVDLLAYRVRGLERVIRPDLTVEPGGNVEAAYDIRAFANLDDALAERPTAVFVTNPNSLHMPVALAAARAGSHLFVEKPLSHNLDGVSELVELVERHRLAALVGYQLRFHPAFRMVHAVLERGGVGRVVAGRVEFGEYLPHWHRYEDYRGYHAARADQGGGVILAQIHDLDVVYALFGLPRRVFAVGGKLSNLEIDVEDTASMVLEYNDRRRTWPVHVHQDCLQRPPVRRYELIGDGGTILWDYFEGTVRVTGGDGASPEIHRFENVERNTLFLDELRHFLACLEGRETPVVSLRDGAGSLRMALAAKRALQTGAVVDVATVT